VTANGSFALGGNILAVVWGHSHVFIDSSVYSEVLRWRGEICFVVGPKSAFEGAEGA